MSTQAPAVPAVQLADPGTDAAYGARMRHRLADMLANTWSFLPDYEERYNVLLAHAQSLTPHQAYAMTMLLGLDSSRGYPDMPNTAQLEFPRVNAADLTAQVGWYYFAGTAFAEDGRQFGVLCMYFRSALLPPAMAHQLGLSDAQNQVVDLQLAVSVEGGPFHQADPVISSGARGEVEVSDQLFLRAGGGSVEALEPGRPFPLRLRAQGTDRGGALPVELEIDFAFTSSRGYLPQGNDGAEPLVAGVGTRYYSIPGLVLDGAGSVLRVGGETVALKGGTFWFDHQWGLGLAPGGAPRHEVLRASANLSPAGSGWDFFVANLEGPYSFTFNAGHTDSAAFMRQTGPTPPGTMHSPLVGKYMDPYGTVFNVSGTLAVTAWKKADHSPNRALYDNVPTWVPNRWEFALVEPVVPERLRKLTFEPICDDANALYFGNGSQYVEAATRVLDASGTCVGTGYSEATAYVDSLGTTMHLAGVPREQIDVFRNHAPSTAMKLMSEAYVLLHQGTLKELLACGSFPPGPRPAGCPA